MFVAFYYTRVGFYYTRVDWGFWISDFFDLGFGIWDLAFLKTGKKGYGLRVTHGEIRC